MLAYRTPFGQDQAMCSQTRPRRLLLLPLRTHAARAQRLESQERAAKDNVEVVRPESHSPAEVGGLGMPAGLL